MAIAYRAHAQTIVSAASSSVTIPAAVQIGDLMIIHAAGGWGPTAVPTGWTSDYFNNSLGNVRGMVVYRIAQAGDPGSLVTINWQGNYACVINFIAFSGSTSLRLPSVHLHQGTATGGSDGTPPIAAGAGDMAVYLGGVRQSGAPTIARGTTAISSDGGTAFGGVIGYELLSVAQPVANTFTSTSGGGYLYSLLLVSDGGALVNSAVVSSNYVEAITVPQADARVSANYIEAAIGGSSSAQIESVYNETLATGAITAQIETIYNEILVSSVVGVEFKGWGIPIRM